MTNPLELSEDRVFVWSKGQEVRGPKYVVWDEHFQLYKKQVLYQSSRDASACDLDFLAHFDKKVTIDGFVCNHLGRKGNWQGRKVGEDFEFDVA